MNKEILAKIQPKLEEDKTRLERELAGFAHKDTEISDNYQSTFPEFGNDEGENAAEVADYSDRVSLEHTLEIQLRDVNKALERIAKGTYGICKYCKNEIEEGRLLARPVSGSCTACKKKLKGET